MKYVITGSAGNISKRLTEKLLLKGHEVSVIGRSEEKLAPLTLKGARALIGSIEDLDFVREAFSGADAVYTMVPPKLDLTTDLMDYMGQVGINYADAIRSNHVKYVVNLSSVGAHLPSGCGPVSGLFKVEQALNAIESTNVLHLRPVYFYSNLFANIGMIKNLNIIGANFGGPDFLMPLTDPEDIASFAFTELNALNFQDHSSVLYIASDERKTEDIARVLGSAIGKPELSWVVFTDEQAYQGMLMAGLPEQLAKAYAEMGHAMQDGTMFEDYWLNKPGRLGKVKLEDFAKEFATKYKQS